MQPSNLVIVMSDEHAGRYAGHACHPVVQTPNLDRLAARGTRFTNAYCNSPICMPSRAAFMSGRYPHQTGHVCNATPYDGSVPAWTHALATAGVPAVSIGKLHFRDADVPSGFAQSLVPMHALNGTGDIFGAIRQSAPLPVRHGVRQVAEQVGTGESDYTRYDRSILAETLAWLRDTAPGLQQPWVLFVSFVCPHFPLIAPEEFAALYDPETLDLPKACRPEDWPDHPWFDAFRASYITDSFFDDALRRRATAAYFGLCSFVDSLVGQVVDAVEASTFGARTRLIYTSDHGDNLGVRGLWQKSNFYQESAHVPMIAAGPEVPAGKVCTTPVSLVDFHPTALHATGVGGAASQVNPDARSLFAIAVEPDDPARTVFGEYHAAGAVTGVYMLRQGPWKYIHYANMPAQLFNLDDDPEEMDDLAGTAGAWQVQSRFEAVLRARLDPEAVDARIKALQRKIVERHGGPEAILSQGSMGASPPPGTTFEGLRKG
ncbi:sulfatase-like hydrolase/transferase [Mameliella sp.]|uniref:sulfatase-like hydrolase/transferase n=1 Tax=Mameliella sp. TaxID=1924940 RepID=UPI003BABC237